ncbi:MAG: hypothetical protein HYR83_08990 [Planctomycetes bacterium]|nr:hypothetical protein [Planctomycetota bacterium]
MVYKKQYTMPVPRGAEITERNGRRVAHWRLRNGQLRSGEVVDCQDGKLRVRGQSRLFIARYRDGSGHVVNIATNCEDEVAARAVLAQLERRAELIRAGVMTASEGDAAEHAGAPLSRHLDAYERHLQAKGCDPRRILVLKRRIERLARDCKFSRLNKMSAGPVEERLVEQANAGMDAATRNSYRESAVCFGNWRRRTHRMTINPLSDIPRVDQKVDRRHKRRALTEAELMRLLKVVRLRPLAEYGREITPKETNGKRSPRSRATWKREPLNFENLDDAVERARVALKENPGLMDQLERIGHERADLQDARFDGIEER